MSVAADGARLQEAARVRRLRLALEEAVRGDVAFDEGARAAYVTDSSNYRQPPIGVVCPLDAEDVVAAMAVCRDHRVPVLARGCGTSLSGETTNHAVVIDTSRHMRQILEVDVEERWARVQPGVIRDQLANQTEAEDHLTFAPDTSTHAYATFGGMIGNNSCGIHSVMAGRTSDNVIELDVVLYDGTRLRVGRTGDDEYDQIVAHGGRRAEIYQALHELTARHADRIRARYPDIPRRVSGYNLDDLLPEHGFHVARSLVGSEGTLAMVLEAKVRLVPSPPGRSLMVLGYGSIFDAADDVPRLMAHDPVALEAIDARLVADMRVHREHLRDLDLLPEGEGWLLVEFGADTQEQAHARSQRCAEDIEEEHDPPSVKVFDDLAETEKVWEIREAGLGATAYVPMERDHWPGWEDAAVPPDRLGSYLRDFRALLDRHGYHAALYGHFGQGCVHCRIDFDLRSAGGVAQWRRFLEDAADLVVGYGGSLSGEHGDGQQRAELLPKMYGDELVGAFAELKRIWDPDGKMNPGKVVEPRALDADLKLGADYAPAQVKTHFAYPEDGGSFAHAALRCVGAGKCRDTSTGTMCPSYMVTLDEKHTTRGRSRVLFEMLDGGGQTIQDGFRSDAVEEALDLCLSCKGCKGDCPVHVDMATYKAEFLAKRYRRRLRPLPAYSMGLIMFHARAAALAPRLANALTQTPGVRQLLQRAGGLTTQRAMPPFAIETFQQWFARRGVVNPHGPPVVLFADTFNDHLHPEVAKATCEALESAGRRVIVPQGLLCCGRPLYDYGMLDLAGRLLDRLLEALRPHIRSGTPVVVAEPSCTAVFRDELVNLRPHDEDAKRLSLQTHSLAEVLTAETAYRPPRLEGRAILHGHCHHKAVWGTGADHAVLERMGLDVEELDSGCCGLAGSFGFERDHYDISMQIGERRLLPAVRQAPSDAVLVSDGFSCKTQVDHGSGRRMLHLGQVIALARTRGPIAGHRPERWCPDVVR